MMCGGTGDTKDATNEIQEICDKIRASLEKKLDRKLNTFVAKSYKSQVVAGTNYFVKIEVEEGTEYIHARIFQSLPHTGQEVTLHSYQTGKTADEQLEFF